MSYAEPGYVPHYTGNILTTRTVPHPTSQEFIASS